MLSFHDNQGAESREAGFPLERFVRAACGASNRRVQPNSAFAPPQAGRTLLFNGRGFLRSAEELVMSRFSSVPK